MRLLRSKAFLTDLKARELAGICWLELSMGLAAEVAMPEARPAPPIPGKVSRSCVRACELRWLIFTPAMACPLTQICPLLAMLTPPRDPPGLEKSA